MQLLTLGIINNLGESKEEIWRNVIIGNRNKLVKREIKPDKSIYVGQINNTLPEITNDKYNIRVNQLLLHCFNQIENDWIKLTKKYKLSRIGMVLGSNNVGLNKFEKLFGNYFQTKILSKELNPSWLECGILTEFMKNITKIRGPNYTISTACSSTAKAFAVARNFIKYNLCDAVLVGGADDLCEFTIQGFDSLSAYAHEKTNPFCKNRDGINIGEGGALFILTREIGEINLIGIGESSDAYHVTSPDPSGKGAILSMSRALNDAKLIPQQIEYINLHGTGTIQNDEMELIAINNVFKNNKIKYSSSKALTGHLLGAAGVTELGLCWLMLSDINKYENLIPHCADGETIYNASGLVKLSETKKVTYCLSNSFAFGGSNASLIIEKRD